MHFDLYKLFFAVRLLIEGPGFHQTCARMFLIYDDRKKFNEGEEKYWKLRQNAVFLVFVPDLT